MADDKRTKVKKGWLAVRVGLEEEEERFRRFEIPISHLHHPLFRNLLETAEEVYGYNTSGPLKFPCSVDKFLHLRSLVESESSARGSQSQRHRVDGRRSISLPSGRLNFSGQRVN